MSDFTITEHDKRLLNILTSNVRIVNDSDKHPDDYKWYITIDNTVYTDPDGNPVSFDSFDDAVDYVYNNNLINKGE